MFTTKSSNTNIQQEQGGGVFNVANVTWGITGADGQYVILSTPSSNYLPNGIQYKLLAAVNVAAQPETTTTQVDVPGDTQFVTAGSFAWQDNITQPVLDQGGAFSLGNGGNIIFTDTSTLSLTDYSESTGALLWSTNPFNNDFSLQSITTGTIAYGMLYNPGYDGYMHAINMTTGVQVWDSITRPGGLEMPEPGYPTSGISVAGATINTGEVFTSTNKAYETMPAYRGHCLYAYNALTGAQNWNVSGEFIGGYLVADGILLTQNSYDGKEYAFGMGQTATTVEAPMNQITAGSNVIIQGTVTDQSPGAPGTPAISDTWMTPWMNYLYMEQPLPTQATGVNVSLDAIDPNGNLVHVGNATSDLTGNFIYQWTPPNIPGKYTIIATFSSDKSYYGSCGETGMTIASPAAAAASPTATPTSVADMYFVPAIAGLAVLIIIGLIILALLMIRKRP
jgi:outer membrane protein assembly factor BamB